MGTTAEAGPLVTFGQAPSFESNPDLGPSAWFAGDMVLDPRSPFTYQPGQPDATQIFGWPTIGAVPIIDQVPATASTTNIANGATPAAGTPLVLASSSVAGVTIASKVRSAATGALISGLLGLDVAAARTVTGTFTNGSPKITNTGVTMFGVQVGDRVTFTTSGTLPTPFALLTTYYVVAIGSLAMMVSATPGGAPISATSAGSGTQTINVTAPGSYYAGPVPFAPPAVYGNGPMSYWNPAYALSRCLIITNNGNDSSGFYTINGYDIYGYPMTQTLVGPSTSTVTSTKAFKYITSVVPSGTIASTSVSVGTVDVFGLPLRTDMASYLNVYYGATPPALIAVGSLTFVGADINTPTALTGDVRGTVYGGSASDGSKRYTIFWNPQASNIAAGQVGLLGQTQF